MRLRIEFLFLIALIISSALFLASVPMPARAQTASTKLPDGFSDNVALTGLHYPSGIVFAPDGRWFIAELNGTIREVKNGTLEQQPIADISDHVNSYLGRAFDIALDPDFESNGYIYLLYTYHRQGIPQAAPETGRLTRIQLDSPNFDKITPYVDPPETVLLGSIQTPYDGGRGSECKADTDCFGDDFGDHAIDQVIFLPDKTMMISVGDGGSADFADSRALRSLDKDWMLGKVLHVDRDGKGLPTNPFWNGDPNAPISKVYEYGLRNPWRITYHPTLGLFAANNGWYRWDMVSHSNSSGANFGWPCFEGNQINFDYAANLTIKPACDALYKDPSQVTPPLFSYPHVPPGQPASIIGGAFYFGRYYPEQYNGSYFYGDLIGGYISRLELDPAGRLVASVPFATNLPSAPVEVFTFPDGDLGWIAFYDGAIHKIAFDRTNLPPVARINANVISGVLPLTVNFRGEGSYDPNSGQLNYFWDFGDGTQSNSTEADISHVYSRGGEYAASLMIRTNSATSEPAQVRIYAGDSPAKATLTLVGSDAGTGTPLLLTDNQPVTFDAQISNENETAGISGQDVLWTLIAHHREYDRTIFDNMTGLQVKFTAENHYLADSKLYETAFPTIDEFNSTDYELRVSITDDEGLTSNASEFFKVLPGPSKYAEDPSYLLLSGNYFSVPSAASNQLSNFSLAAWFRTVTDYKDVGYIIHKGEDVTPNGNNTNYGIWMNSANQVEAGFKTNGAYAIVASSSPFNDGRWHYAVATYDGHSVALYVDGQEVSELATQFAPPIKNSLPVTIGASSQGTGKYFDGRIDEVRIWNRALTSSEVLSQYSDSSFNTAGQVVYLPFYDQKDPTLSAVPGALYPLGAVGSISKGRIVDSTIDVPSRSISLRVEPGEGGPSTLTIWLPRGIVDAKSGPFDENFTVMTSSGKTSYDEVETTDNYRVLVVTLPAGSEQVIVTGTSIVPEFPQPFLIVVGGVMAAIFAAYMIRTRFKMS